MSKENLNITVTFRHMESTEALRNYTVDKISRVLSKYSVKDGVEAMATLIVEKRSQSVEIRVKSIGFELSAKATDNDMYAAIDEAASSLEAQIRKQKSKQNTAKHKP